MNKLIYALRFEGTAEPRDDTEKVLAVSSLAPSSCVTSMVSDTGIDGSREPLEGGAAMFTSTVTATGEGTFEESGRVTFGREHGFTFETVGAGHLGEVPESDVKHGAVIWEITAGTGQFEGATGLITSNFTVGAQGKVVDEQTGVIFLP
ncbi:MAG: hypothetical protein HRU14_14965 [Planctomycetes bacterium]|jgi:hypothetical protein|nr:hypothetical protein [Planctomycetota bacterium]